MAMVSQESVRTVPDTESEYSQHGKAAERPGPEPKDPEVERRERRRRWRARFDLACGIATALGGIAAVITLMLLLI